MKQPPVIFVVMQTGARSNGGIQSIGEIMRRLKGHRAIVLTNIDNEFAAAWRQSGIEVHIAPAETGKTLARAPFEYASTQIRYYGKLTELIRSSGAHILHANDPVALQLSIPAAKVTGAKLVFNLRGTVGPGHRPPRLKYRLFFAAADHVLYLSRDMARRWNEVAPNATRSFSVTYSIVDPSRFQPSPIDPEAQPFVLVSGLFWRTKGQLDFIRQVVPILAENGVKICFTGDFDLKQPSYGDACVHAAQAHGDAVAFLGYRSDIPELIAQSRVVVVPSFHEGLARIMLEGMSCARPVVSFDVSSAHELLDEESGGAGTVVRSGDYDGMAEAIVYYCRDSKRAGEAGRKGAATAARLFTPEVVVSHHERVYEQLEAGERADEGTAHVDLR